MTENAFSMKRLCKLFVLLFASVFLPAICGMLRNVRLDHLIVWCFICLCSFLCFTLYIEHERLHGDLIMGTSNNYAILTFVYLIGLFAACIMSFLPAFTAPVMALSALCNGTFRTKLGVTLAVYFSLLVAIFSEGSAYVTAAYVLLALIGVYITELFMHRELQLWSGILIFSLSVVIPACCHYLDNHMLNAETVLFSIIGSLMTILVLIVVPRLRNREIMAESISLDTIMDEHYHLHKEIARYSSVDYQHALRTSRIAARVAVAIGADEKLAKAGGFYYRIGKLEGDPFIENGVRIAQHNCFPERLVGILEEYNGMHRLPSTIESAIVQISDMIVTKFDLLDKDTFSSGWNREIVIYQSMNEKSAEGMYDQSGLSMNQFLMIRELLVKEELLV